MLAVLKNNVRVVKETNSSLIIMWSNGCVVRTTRETYRPATRGLSNSLLNKK
ncbi:hypothetical protein Bpfe_004390, partial [Biomphalaria pfeifferi]